MIGRTRGATAATSGSPKWAARDVIHSGPASQSLSRNATSRVDTWASPSLRAGPGPPELGRRIKVAPCLLHSAAISPACRDPSSTTITG